MNTALPWRRTFLPDPVTAIHPAKGSSLLCARQLTSVVGLSKDLELLEKRLGGGGSWGEAGSKKGQDGKGKEGKGRKGKEGDKGGKGQKEGKEGKDE